MAFAKNSVTKKILVELLLSFLRCVLRHYAGEWLSSVMGPLGF